jgi:quinol monooxygenase YgiN
MKYGLIGKFTAHPGRRDELVAMLLRAAEALQSDPTCLQYVVGTTAEPDAIWVTEVWTSKEAHDASLEPEETRALIQQAMPLVASMSDQTQLDVVGGKGVQD